MYTNSFVSPGVFRTTAIGNAMVYHAHFVLQLETKKQTYKKYHRLKFDDSFYTAAILPKFRKPVVVSETNKLVVSENRIGIRIKELSYGLAVQTVCFPLDLSPFSVCSPSKRFLFNVPLYTGYHDAS